MAEHWGRVGARSAWSPRLGSVIRRRRTAAIAADAEERLIQKLPQDFAQKVVWGSRYPQHDTTSAHDAIAMLAEANVPEQIIARMMGGNAATHFGIDLLELAHG